MALKAYWAYEFKSDTPIEAMHTVLNEAGPWTWTMRDSHWYGDYLNCRPGGGVRVRIHAWEDAKYSALMQIDSEGTAEQAAVDAIMWDLLGRLQAENVAEIEPYD